MMDAKALLTKRRIEKLAAEYEGWDEPESHAPEDGGKYDVFISHSSRDEVFIRKVLLFLKHSKSVQSPYVDWQDPAMEHETDARTAADLKDRIKNSKKVIYVVTSESLKSVWCSWEIGFADCDKGVEDVAILAVKPNNGRWKNHEYLQQYPWISYDLKKRLFMVTMPGEERKRTLYEWLRYNVNRKYKE